MTQTRSDLLLERFCAERSIACQPISTGTAKTADYTLTWNDLQIATEVKQIDAKDVPSEPGEIRVHSTTPGEHVRRKINKAGPQIRQRIAAGEPSFLIIYNDMYRQICIYSEPYDFLVAMYGLQNVILGVPRDGSTYIKGHQFGPKRKMTETSNTSFSALARLREDPAENLFLDIFHNVHAAVPLSISATRANGVSHYVVPGDLEEFTMWQPANQDSAE